MYQMKDANGNTRLNNIGNPSLHYSGGIISCGGPNGDLASASVPASSLPRSSATTVPLASLAGFKHGRSDRFRKCIGPARAVMVAVGRLNATMSLRTSRLALFCLMRICSSRWRLDDERRSACLYEDSWRRTRRPSVRLLASSSSFVVRVLCEPHELEWRLRHVGDDRRPAAGEYGMVFRNGQIEGHAVCCDDSSHVLPARIQSASRRDMPTRMVCLDAQPGLRKRRPW